MSTPNLQFNHVLVHSFLFSNLHIAAASSLRLASINHKSKLWRFIYIKDQNQLSQLESRLRIQFSYYRLYKIMQAFIFCIMVVYPFWCQSKGIGQPVISTASPILPVYSIFNLIFIIFFIFLKLKSLTQFSLITRIRNEFNK